MSSLSLNKVILCGRLTADPELKQTQSGISVISFTLAINRRYSGRTPEAQPQADFISLVAWRQTAEFIAKFFKKGSAICVTGSIQTRSWTDQQNQKRYITEVVVEDAMFVDSRSDSSAQGDAYAPEAFMSPAFSSENAPKFEEVTADDDMPF